MKYAYFPGCSLERNAASYDISTREVAKKLDMELVEVEDWNCCGATEYISLNLTASMALIARNLAQASRNPGVHQLVAPCSACYLNLRKCDTYMAEDAELAKKVNTALNAGGLSYKAGTIRARHLLDVIYNDVGLKVIAEKVTKPLKGLRIAPYYGCMILRPKFINGCGAFDNTDYPMTLDELLAALGAEVIDFPMKAHCCGGHMTQISESTGFEMIRRLVKGATDYKADMIVTLCPMCQLNLDAFQGAMNGHFKTSYNMPVLYFTQMMGIAFGMEAARLGVGSELVDARPALSKIGVNVPPPAAADEGIATGAGEVAAAPVGATAAPKKAKKDDKSLPMPSKRHKREVKP